MTGYIILSVILVRHNYVSWSSFFGPTSYIFGSGLNTILIMFKCVTDAFPKKNNKEEKKLFDFAIFY